MKLLIGIVVVLAVVGAGAWYFSTQKMGGMPMTLPTMEETTKEEGTTDDSGTTFADLAAQKGELECAVSADIGDTVSEGTVFLSAGNVRGEFKTEISGQTVTTHIIQAAGYVYTWTSLLPQGMKVKISAAAGTAGGQGIDPSTKVEYTCKPWAFDPMKYIVPSGVTFVEVGASGSTYPLPQPN